MSATPVDCSAPGSATPAKVVDAVSATTVDANTLAKVLDGVSITTADSGTADSSTPAEVLDTVTTTTVDASTAAKVPDTVPTTTVDSSAPDSSAPDASTPAKVLDKVPATYRQGATVIERLVPNYRGAGPCKVENWFFPPSPAGKHSRPDFIENAFKIKVGTMLQYQGIFTPICAEKDPVAGFRWVTEHGHVLRIWDGGIETIYQDEYVEPAEKGDGYKYYMTGPPELSKLAQFPNFNGLYGMKATFFINPKDGHKVSRISRNVVPSSS